MKKETSLLPDHSVSVALSKCRVEGNVLFLPEEQLDRNVYLKLKKALEDNHGKYQRGGYFTFDFEAEWIWRYLMHHPTYSMKKEHQYFPTPEEVAIDLLNTMLGIMHEPIDILEPSAGRGALIKALEDFGYEHDGGVDFCEINPVWRRELVDMGHNPVGTDFIEYAKTTTRRYDLIVANPPFSKKQDAKHILHMFRLLKPNGVLVSMASSAVKFRSDKEYKLLREMVEENGTMRETPKGSFRSSGTMVDTVMIGYDNEVVSRLWHEDFSARVDHVLGIDKQQKMF